MKTLLILRHAKTEKDAPKGDAKRVLTERGKRDAAAIAKDLKSIKGCPDAIVTSDAKRALQTADIVIKKIGFDKSPIVEKEIYGAYVDDLLDVIHRFPDKADCVVLVGHNPGLEELCKALTENNDPNFHLPTAGLLHLQFDIDHWKDVQPDGGRMVALHSPKQPSTQDAGSDGADGAGAERKVRSEGGGETQ